MRVINNNLLVEFESIENKSGIIIPERYKIAEDDGVGSQWGVTTDRRLINPQVVNVIEGKYKGKKCFVHYGAYEIAQWHDGKAIIPEQTVFFTLDPLTPLEGFYLGDEVFTEGEKTASGIYITPYAEKKEPVVIKLTHVYEGSSLKVGDEVITIDGAQYHLDYDGKKYIKLKESEIIGKRLNGSVEPLNGAILIEYISDEKQSLREAENERRRQSKDMAIKFRLHAPDVDFEEVAEPKYTDAVILNKGEGKHLMQLELSGVENGSKVCVRRNFGCFLPNGQWLIKLDHIEFVYA